MSKRVYISADYSENNGDRDVVNILKQWGTDDLHKVEFKDTSEVASGSVSKDPDCRSCDLKKEFNQQINASSAVIFVVGDRTASRQAGSGCSRITDKNCRCPHISKIPMVPRLVKWFKRVLPQQMILAA